MSGPRVLIAGVGNLLRGDDGFGPAVVRALEAGELPEGTRTVELGIGGVGLVHELMEGYDALILIDAVDRQGAPGSLYLLEPDVPEAMESPARQGPSPGGDLHEAVPGQALLMARAVGALPPFIRIVGCQPAETEELTLELSPVVRQAIPAAVATVHQLLRNLFNAVPEGP